MPVQCDWQWRSRRGARKCVIHHSDQGSPYTSIAFGHRAGREGRMAPPGAEQKSGDETEDKLSLERIR
jgi:transposase InsO family protein